MARDNHRFPPFDYFQFGNVFCGSLGQLRWRVEPRPTAEPPVLHCWKWRNGLCYEKREEDCPQGEFPLTPEGLEELKGWLEE